MRTVDVKIEDVAFGGKGIARDNGKAVFVPYTIDGELVSAKITREKKQFAEAEVVDLRERSPHRVEPPCPYFGRCGGCAYQHIDYAHQLEIKSHQVRDVLSRIGKLRNVPLQRIVLSPRQYGYRNRVTIHAENGIIGFFQRDSHRLIDVERCPIAMDEVNAELAELRSHDLRDGHYTLRAKVDQPLRGESTRSENAFRHFTQTNDGIAAALQNLIVDMVPTNQELLIDAFCGAGFFAKALITKFGRIVGIDWDHFAIARAKENAGEKETYLAGNVDEELDAQLRRTNLDKTTLLLDPPATGLSPSLRRSIVDLAPATTIYISCNPATLARDLADLVTRFKIESVTPLDMFPQTAEIEVVVHLQRTSASAI